MHRCKGCGDTIIGDGTEDRDWAEYCECCEWDEDYFDESMDDE